MTNIIQHWLRGIAAFMILLPIISQILSNKVYKKYINYFTGLLFILIVLQPFTNLFSIDELLKEKLQDWNLEAQLQDVGQLDIPVQAGVTPEQILNMDEGQLQTWIQTVAAKYELQIEDSHAALCTDSTSDDYGTITYLYIKVQSNKEKDKNAIEFFKKEILEGLDLKRTMLKVEVDIKTNSE